MPDYDPDFQVYTDMNQCDRFEVPYFDTEAELVVAASTLLESKGPGGYDASHTEFLSQFGSGTLVLRRTGEQCPGWWRVHNFIPTRW